MDKYYKRHVLANQMKHMNGGNVKILGTIRMNNVDAINRTALKTTIDLLKNATQCT